jgi:isoprenylcysteine carboxyl methyltransferase (ICMT) family protein YpbQ
MADILQHPQHAAEDLRDLRAHEQTFHRFGKLVLFAILHVMLVLSCLALAFLGHSPLIALFLGIGGTALLLAVFTVL